MSDQAAGTDIKACAPKADERGAVQNAGGDFMEESVQESTLQAGLRRYLSASQLERLGSATVGIAGAGGLGSNCAMMLARSGVRHFVIADHDSIEPSNLNRQFFFADQTGRSKVAALRDNLQAIDPEIRVVVHRLELTEDNVSDVFAECSIVVEALDGVDGKKMLAEAFMGRKDFFVSASGMAGWGGPDMRTRRVRDVAAFVGDFVSDIAAMPPMAPRVTMVAAMQADAVLAHILGSCRSE
ncbi:sulfur carrier protein ThiS adenylyltransferase ThiF [Desulfovibrio mangrovi]|uniref:sulfur carrier protein ThiS adenylyltransferase ThiF n=1 Tax=Desulfovibrio mangrovi TaxID=2976983 RepID=UPI002246B2AE|nr:sulfur carrier protein ThiS adenylyltransferase ThiF [Desulfovibrio mangrovi]UZP67818.1 sulfur carrier protein ThiS adenylyltransferase ThiF [Desulfovibrio mangrovi]